MPYANKKIRELCYSMVNTPYNSTQDINKKLQSLKGKTKLKFYKNISNYYDEMNFRRQSGTFQFEEDPFSKNVQGIGKSYHEVLLLMKFSQIKPPIKNKNMNNKFYDLYYTVFENGNEKELVNDENENNENGYSNFNDFIIPNHYIGRKK